MPCVFLLWSRASQIELIEVEDNLQLISSSDVKVSLFWFRSLHNPLTCANKKAKLEEQIFFFTRNTSFSLIFEKLLATNFLKRSKQKGTSKLDYAIITFKTTK